MKASRTDIDRLLATPGAKSFGIIAPVTGARSASPAFPGRLPSGDPGSWRLEIGGWRPALLNDLIGRHPMSIARRKRRDADQVARACFVFAVPAASGRRRVGVTIRDRFRRFPDDDSVWKSLMDALTRVGALVDDSREWCEFGRPEFERGSRRTVIVLEDLES